MRLLDVPTPVSAAEQHRSTRFADPTTPWPELPCVNGTSSASSSQAAPSCTADVAVLIAGEFRDFVPPVRPNLQKWRNITAQRVWSQLYDKVVKPNGPADLFVHSWTNALAHELVAQVPVRPCATVCEAYDREYVERVLARYGGFRVIRGFLRLNHTKETPHIVDFFYKRYAALQLLQAFEKRHARTYRAVVLSRPDVYVLSATTVQVPPDLAPGTIYMHNSDHHHDSTDKDTTADPMARGLCGQMPNDWFAFGDRAAMGQYLSAFVTLPQTHVAMRATKGSCDWWRCHNYRYNFTFLNSAESYLGFHLRLSGLRCRELMHAKPPVHMMLPPVRRRDWGDWRDFGPGAAPSWPSAAGAGERKLPSKSDGWTAVR